jgi:ammonia channel protein AmtB
VFAGHQDGACSWLKRPKVHDIPGHNSPLVALGIFILWYDVLTYRQSPGRS